MYPYLQSVNFHSNVRSYIFSIRSISISNQYALAVMELIDAGTCADLTVSTNCDTAVTGYFETFEYNGNRVIISSGAPNHAAETDAYLGGTLSNRFLRCKL